MEILTKTWLRPASSGSGEIYSKLWHGDEKRAIVQISHGMAEHSGRYNHFASFLAERGFVVCINEHAGHGPHAENLGYFAEQDGIKHVISDMKVLHDEIMQEFPEIPIFLLGHSMGSFLSRKFITSYGDGLAGCILSGTAGPNSALGFGKMIAAIQKKTKGPMSEGNLLDKIAFGSYLKTISNPVNENAWLSRVDELCKEYENDTYCGFKFTAGGFYDLFTLLEEINNKDWANKVPISLPIYIFSGDDDPVGEYGKGVLTVYNRLLNAKLMDVTLKLYPRGRHEMLNEINKEEVYEDVLNWLLAHLR